MMKFWKGDISNYLQENGLFTSGGEARTYGMDFLVINKWKEKIEEGYAKKNQQPDIFEKPSTRKSTQFSLVSIKQRYIKKKVERSCIGKPERNKYN